MVKGSSAVIDRIKVLRSKNAGPFVVTFDVVFGDAADYKKVKRQLTADKIAAAFRVGKQDVVSFDFFEFEELYAAKISLKRRRPCGHPGDPDCYAMNQEQPLAELLGELVPN